MVFGQPWNMQLQHCLLWWSNDNSNSQWYFWIDKQKTKQPVPVGVPHTYRRCTEEVMEEGTADMSAAILPLSYICFWSQDIESFMHSLIFPSITITVCMVCTPAAAQAKVLFPQSKMTNWSHYRKVICKDSSFFCSVWDWVKLKDVSFLPVLTS